MHHFEINRREKEGITILDVKGRLVVGEASTMLRERLNEQVSKDIKQIVLNLEHVDYIDSTGLGTMVICYTTLQKSGGGLTLVRLNRRNLELMILTKLSTIFQIYADEQDAVNSFFPEREIKHFDILSFVQQSREIE
jgi:anti-sigma B factor antagonist